MKLESSHIQFIQLDSNMAWNGQHIEVDFQDQPIQTEQQIQDMHK